MANKLYVIEGIDGSGKTTICKRIAKLTNSTYIKNPPKEFSNINCNGELELFRYLAGLIFNINKIKTELEKNNVICDRYLATFIVDSKQLGIDFDIENLTKLLPIPTKTIHLTAKYETIVKRLKSQENLTNWELRLIKDKSLYDQITNDFSKLSDVDVSNDQEIDKAINEFLLIMK